MAEIDREKVIKGLEQFKTDFKPFCGNRADWERFDAGLALLKEYEAVSAHWDDNTGHWIEGDRNGIDTHTRTTGEMIDTFRCSWCGYYMYWKTPFCPNCGAKMKGR